MKYQVMIPITSEIGKELIPVQFETTGLTTKVDGVEYMEVQNKKGTFTKFVERAALDSLQDSTLVKVLQD